MHLLSKCLTFRLNKIERIELFHRSNLICPATVVQPLQDQLTKRPLSYPNATLSTRQLSVSHLRCQIRRVRRVTCTCCLTLTTARATRMDATHLQQFVLTTRKHLNSLLATVAFALDRTPLSLKNLHLTPGLSQRKAQLRAVFSLFRHQMSSNLCGL